jgi:hypothetical protein
MKTLKELISTFLQRKFLSMFVLSSFLLLTPKSGWSKGFIIEGSYETGFERINTFANGGISYFILSDSITIANINTATGIGRGSWWIFNVSQETAVYEAAPNMTFAVEESIKNTSIETGFAFSAGRQGSWSLVFGQQENSYITDMTANVITMESLAQSYMGMKFILDFYSKSSAGIRMEGHFKYFTGATGETIPTFEIEKGHNFGGKLILEIGNRRGTGFLLRMHAGYDYSEYQVNSENNTRTQLKFGVGIQKGF